MPLASGDRYDLCTAELSGSITASTVGKRAVRAEVESELDCSEGCRFGGGGGGGEVGGICEMGGAGVLLTWLLSLATGLRGVVAIVVVVF